MRPLAIPALLACLATTAAAAAATADDIIPKAFAKDRYSETVKKSPFILETKTVEVGPVPDSILKNLYLRGVGKADGKDYVLIQRLGEERAMRFVGNEPGPDGLAVKTVRLGSNFRETKVVVQKGSETGEIGFKEDTISAPHPAPGARGPALPGQFQRPPIPPQMPSTRVPLPTPVQPGSPTRSSPEGSDGSQRTRVRAIRN